MMTKKMLITAGELEISSLLNNTETAQAFAKTLPRTITMKGSLDREFYGYIDEQLPLVDQQVTKVKDGDIVFWIKGNGIAVFYDTSVKPTLGSPMIIIGEMQKSFRALAEMKAEVQMTFSLLD